jgi:hypothetical protein
MAPEIIWSSWLFRLTKFANISGKYVLFDVAVFDLQYTHLITYTTAIMSSGFRENNNNRIHAITALVFVVFYTLYFQQKYK